MKVAELLERRRANWQELESLIQQMQNRGKRAMGAAAVTRFATLYRAACADLALAHSYQLPPRTVQYLHRLVARAHNQLYRSRTLNVAAWSHTLLHEVPQRIFNDRCVQFMFILFWGTFLISALLAYSETRWPEYAEAILGRGTISSMEEQFDKPIGRAGEASMQNFRMAGFYIRHNTGIGLQCFAGGLVVVPGLFVTLYNAAHLGGCFGYMARPDVQQGENFFHFVTAHGPFELTAIVLAAGSGLRLGLGWIHTYGLTRTASLEKTAKESLPVMGASMVMFFLAAMIEGFLSPSVAPYWIKAVVALLSCGMLLFYFVVLGFPRSVQRAAG